MLIGELLYHPMDRYALKLRDIIWAAHQGGGRIILAGNGGSAATAAHFACDLMRNTGHRIAAIDLTSNISTLTAIANDYGYRYVFGSQLVNLGQPGDLVIMFSVSGESENLLWLTRVARSMGIDTAAMLGKDGGKLLDLVDTPILIPSRDYGFVEDLHLMLCHSVTRKLKELSCA